MRSLVTLAIVLATGPALADGNARSLAEAGWQAFQKRDLAEAEQLTREAIALARTDLEVRGAAHYNLGRILEDRGDRPGAIMAYRDSLTARRNAIVRDRLRVLDRAAAESFDPFSPQPMKGPFSSIVAYCKKSLEIYADKEVRAKLEPRCDDGIYTIDARLPVKLPAPFQEVRVVRIPEIPQSILAVQVGGAWYVQEIDPFEDPPNCHGKTKVDSVLGQPGARLRVSYTIDGDCERRDHEWGWSERGFVVVGVGISKVPSVTAPFRLAITETESKPHRTSTIIESTATWAKDGSVEIVITRSSGDARTRGGIDATQDLRGHHTLTFP